MPVEPTSFVPKLLKNIFKKYLQKFAEYSDLTELKNSIEYKQFYIELNLIFGEVLHAALKLLDEQKFVVYELETYGRKIIEITERQNSANVFKLLPEVNYCSCEFFGQHVLGLMPTLTLESHSTLYTCPHVLAAHLIEIIRFPSKRTEILPKHKFNYLLHGMIPSAER